MECKTSYSQWLEVLKEYQNRWYLVGIISGTSNFRTFGIDRINELEVLQDNFIPKTSTNPFELFENTIGLTYSEADIEEIILSFTSLQGKYIKSLPLHKSQNILKDNDQELVVRLLIVPNFEFIQKILMLGDAVTVIKPKWLQNDIKKTISKTLKKYK